MWPPAEKGSCCRGGRGRSTLPLCHVGVYDIILCYSTSYRHVMLCGWIHGWMDGWTARWSCLPSEVALRIRCWRQMRRWMATPASHETGYETTTARDGYETGYETENLKSGMKPGTKPHGGCCGFIFLNKLMLCRIRCILNQSWLRV